MDAGAAGAVFTVTASDCGVLLPQALFATTRMLPLLLPAVALMVLVAEVPVQPDGNDQLYDVAPGSVVTLNVCAEPEQNEVLPVIAAGCAGTGVTVTASVCAVLVPQALFAVTVMLPPAAPAVATMELPVEEPLQPEGNVHV